jgi:hypothetical protein
VEVVAIQATPPTLVTPHPAFRSRALRGAGEVQEGGDAGGLMAGANQDGACAESDTRYIVSLRNAIYRVLDLGEAIMAEEKWLVEGEKTIELGAITALKVSLVGGQVDIIGHDEPTTRIEVHSVRGKGLKVVLDGHSLVIDHPQLNWDNFIEVFRSFRGTAKADVSITVPRAVALRLGVVSANALVSGLTKDATLSTVGGELVADGMVGDLQLNAVNGEMSVRNHTGAIKANTVNGDVTASGAITSFGVDGVSGSIYLDATGTPDEVRVNTVAGNVTARLAPNTAVQYKINTVGGHVNLDNAEISGIGGSYNAKYGSLDKSWTDFRANTVSGDVSVLHAVTA